MGAVWRNQEHGGRGRGPPAGGGWRLNNGMERSMEMEEEHLDQESVEEAWTEAETPDCGAGRETDADGEDGRTAGPGEQTPASGDPLEIPEAAGAAETADVREAPRRSPEDLRGELREFMGAFPGVRGEEVPKAVWDAAVGGQNLTLAYSLHRTLSLERELSALRQDRENRQRSTGSQAKNAPGSTEDLISTWWNEAE